MKKSRLPSGSSGSSPRQSNHISFADPTASPTATEEAETLSFYDYTEPVDPSLPLTTTPTAVGGAIIASTDTNRIMTIGATATNTNATTNAATSAMVMATSDSPRQSSPRQFSPRRSSPRHKSNVTYNWEEEEEEVWSTDDDFTLGEDDMNVEENYDEGYSDDDTICIGSDISSEEIQGMLADVDKVSTLLILYFLYFTFK